jgi:hypothetical protein
MAQFKNQKKKKKDLSMTDMSSTQKIKMSIDDTKVEEG